MSRSSQATARGAGLVLVLGIVSWASPSSALSGPSPSAVSAQTLKLPDGPASVHGLSDEASISVFSGQIGYSVPIDLPKGPGGFGPSFSLNYAGELGNGPVGIGWTLGSIAIRRSVRNGVPTYTDADELEITGIGEAGRLVAIAADEYRVEGQGNRVRVLRRGNRFDVTDGDGTRYRLGTSDASREESGSRTSAWFADTITNIAGQTVTLGYDNDGNEAYLSQIRWGQGDIYQVDLVYAGRNDRVVSYRTGFARTCARRLIRIDVFTAFTSTRSRLRSYELSYDDDTFPVSRLSSLRMYGTDASLAMPTLTFTYARPEPPAVQALGGTDGWVLNERGVSFADVNGDGAEDLLRLEAGNHVYRQNRGGTFGDPVALQGANDIDLESSRLVDLDGDARPELVHIVDDTWRYYKLVGTSWVPQGEWPGTRNVPLQAPSWTMCDVNGDGRTDVVRATTGGLSVYLNGKNGLQPPVSLPRVSAADVDVDPGNPNVRFVDMNGDGVVDVVWLTDAWMRIYLGQGDGTFVPWERVDYPWGQAAFAVSELQLADLNRDGLMDVVRVSGGNVYWYPGLANGHLSANVRHVSRPESAAADAVVTVSDANGNGSPDLVWSSPRGMWVLDLSGPTSAGMLAEIANGLGKTTRFKYASSASLAISAAADGHAWTRLLPTNIPVVVDMEIDPGGGEPLRVRHYDVHDGFWDGVERRMGGFLGATEQTLDADGPVDTMVTETSFLEGLGDERVLRGRAAMTRVLDGNVNLYTTTRTDWKAIAPTDLDATNPLLRKAVSTIIETLHSEGLSIPLVTRTEFSAFDAEARATVEHQYGRVDRAGDEKVITRSYADDATRWIRDRPVEETISEESGLLVASKRTYYGSRSGAPVALGQLGEGYIRRVDGLLNPGARWVPQSTRDYDACGNVAGVTEGGVTRVITWDARCLHPVTETITSLMGPVPLTWGMTWNDALVEPATIQDPNGDVTSVQYDKLAREIAVSINGAPAHIHYAYDWTAPLPKTTTWVFDGAPADLASEGATWPNGPHWRATTAVSDGAGEALYTSLAMGSRYLIGSWTERDERGAVTRTADTFYSAVAFPTAPVAGTRVHITDHDALGRVRTQIASNGALKRFFYRALGQTVTSDDLGPVSSDFDGLSRVAHTERDTGVAVETVDAQYDAADRLVSMSLQGGAAVHSFEYDTLGRFVHAEDPDVGIRTLVYDDRNLLVQHTNGLGQPIYFDYDGAGRLVRRGDGPTADASTDYTYTYDLASAATSSDCHVATRLAGVTEPTGEVHFCYDDLGRQTGMARLISVPDAPPAGGSVSKTFSLSGLALTELSDDGFSISYRYDAAGRVVAVSSDGSDLWTADGADDLDGAGRIEHERYGNATTQTYEYDALGLVSHLKVTQPSAASLYDVTVVRNSYGAPKIVTDLDGRGLDQSATYGYDAAGRLTAATLGALGPQQFAFTYAYDVLQNLTSRTVSGPAEIGVLTGTYRYGERGYGPRQLTSVVP